MNRRKAIFRISAGLLIISGTFVGLKLQNFVIEPDYNYLYENYKLLDALSETIIPKTEIPGASDAEVYKFITTMIQNCIDKKSSNNFIAGLKEIQIKSLNNYNKVFEDCTVNEKENILNNFNTESPNSNSIINKMKLRISGEPFFLLLKRLTVEGYCTSMVGATNAFAYLSIPGSYKGCINFTSGQKAWFN